MRLQPVHPQLDARHVVRAARFEWQLAWSRSRRRLAILLYALPVGLAVGVVALHAAGLITTLGSDALTGLVGAVYLQILLVIVPLVFGTGLVAQEAEARTLVYLLMRPLSRGSLLVGKFLGAWIAATLMLSASVLCASVLLLGMDGFADAGVWVERLLRVFGVLALGALAYGALFTFVGLVFARPALVGLAVAFGWETAIPFLPGSLRLFTVRHHLAAFLPADLLPAALRVALAPPPPLMAFAWLVVSAALLMTAAVVAFSRRDYV
jgi:ABC-type transport system involved in multi-copper enzyme maturation permease subunit